MPIKMVHTFWFISVEDFLKLEEHDCPRFQSLRDRGLVRPQEIHLREIFSGILKGIVAAVSHRWVQPQHFDPHGIKMRRLKKVLKEHPSIKFLWIDWLCMPQIHGGGRSKSDTAYFKETLSVILPNLFLGVTVIILYERQYNTRFWPLVETFVAMHTATANGLVPASGGQYRPLIASIFESEGKEETAQLYLESDWHQISTEEAILTLRSDTVQVTNKTDKAINLKILEYLDTDLKALALANVEHTGVPVLITMQCDGYSHVILKNEKGCGVAAIPNETLVHVLIPGGESESVQVQAVQESVLVRGWAKKRNLQVVEDGVPQALFAATTQSMRLWPGALVRLTNESEESGGQFALVQRRRQIDEQWGVCLENKESRIVDPGRHIKVIFNSSVQFRWASIRPRSVFDRVLGRNPESPQWSDYKEVADFLDIIADLRRQHTKARPVAILLELSMVRIPKHKKFEGVNAMAASRGVQRGHLCSKRQKEKKVDAAVGNKKFEGVGAVVELKKFEGADAVALLEQFLNFVKDMKLLCHRQTVDDHETDMDAFEARDFKTLDQELVVNLMMGETTQAVTLQTVDFAGQEQYYILLSLFLASYGLCLVVFTLEKVSRRQLRFWLSQLLQEAPSSRILLVATHKDMFDAESLAGVLENADQTIEQVTSELAGIDRRMYKNADDGLLFFPVDNSRTVEDDGLSRLRTAIEHACNDIASSMEETPLKWLKFQDFLRQKIAKSQGSTWHWAQSHFNELAREHEICPQEICPCLAYFEKSGFLTRIQHSDVMIIDPQHAVVAMADLMACHKLGRVGLGVKTHPDFKRLKSQGRLTKSLVEAFWPRETEHGRNAILKVLQQNDLIIQESENSWLVPSLMPFIEKPFLTDTIEPPKCDSPSPLLLEPTLPLISPMLLVRLLCRANAIFGAQFDLFEADAMAMIIFEKGLASQHTWKAEVLCTSRNPIRWCLINGRPETALPMLRRILDETLLAWGKCPQPLLGPPCPYCSGARMHCICLKELLQQGYTTCRESGKSRVVQANQVPSIRQWQFMKTIFAQEEANSMSLEHIKGQGTNDEMTCDDRPENHTPDRKTALAGKERIAKGQAIEKVVDDCLEPGVENAMAGEDWIENALNRDAVVNVVKKGVQDAQESALCDGTAKPSTIKMIVVGEARAGKTSLLKSLVGRPFNPDEDSTHGLTAFQVTTRHVDTRSWHALAKSEVLSELEKGVSSYVTQRLRAEHAQHLAQNITRTEDQGLQESASDTSMWFNPFSIQYRYKAHYLQYISRSQIRWVKAGVYRRWQSTGQRMQRCQDLNASDYIIGGSRLARIIISSPWLNEDHPDPYAFSLEHIVREFDRLGVGDGDLVYQDFCSVPQWNKSHPDFRQFGRTKEEEQQFRMALADMQDIFTLGYGRVIIVPQVPEYAENTTPYIRRGWCFFELAISSRWGHIFNADSPVVQALLKETGMPLSNQMFLEAFKEKLFTRRGDKAAVIEMYKRLSRRF